MNAIADGLFWAGYPNQIVYLEKITASILQHHLPPIYDPDLATIVGHSLSSCHSVLRKPPLFPRAQLNQRLRKGGGWIGCDPIGILKMIKNDSFKKVFENIHIETKS